MVNGGKSSLLLTLPRHPAPSPSVHTRAHHTHTILPLAQTSISRKRRRPATRCRAPSRKSVCIPPLLYRRLRLRLRFRLARPSCCPSNILAAQGGQGTCSLGHKDACCLARVLSHKTLSVFAVFTLPIPLQREGGEREREGGRGDRGREGSRRVCGCVCWGVVMERERERERAE